MRISLTDRPGRSSAGELYVPNGLRARPLRAEPAIVSEQASDKPKSGDSTAAERRALGQSSLKPLPIGRSPPSVATSVRSGASPPALATRAGGQGRAAASHRSGVPSCEQGSTSLGSSPNPNLPPGAAAMRAKAQMSMKPLPAGGTGRATSQSAASARPAQQSERKGTRRRSDESERASRSAGSCSGTSSSNFERSGSSTVLAQPVVAGAAPVTVVATSVSAPQLASRLHSANAVQVLQSAVRPATISTPEDGGSFTSLYESLLARKPASTEPSTALPSAFGAPSLDPIAELPSPERSATSPPEKRATPTSAKFMQSTLNYTGPSHKVDRSWSSPGEDGDLEGRDARSPTEIRDGTPREMVERYAGLRELEATTPPPELAARSVRSKPIEPHRSPPLPPAPQQKGRRQLPDGTALPGGLAARREEVERAVSAIPPTSKLHSPPPMQVSSVPPADSMGMSNGAVSTWLPSSLPGSTDVAHGLQRLRGEYQNLLQQRRESETARAEEKRRATSIEEALTQQNTKMANELAKLKLMLKQQQIELDATIGRSSDESTSSEPQGPILASGNQLRSIGGLKAQQITPTMEAMRMNDLHLHTQTVAARVLQRAARMMRNHAKRRKKSGATFDLKTAALEATRIENDKRARSVDAARSKMNTNGNKRNAVSPPKAPPPSSSTDSSSTPPQNKRESIGRFVMPLNAFVAGGRTRDALGNEMSNRLDRRIGSPCAAVFNAMEREHSSEISFSAHGATLTTPRSEWLYVIMHEVGARPDRAADCTPERVGWRLDDFVRCDIARKAGLVREEVIALRLHTGPMSELYNAVLHSQRKDEFTTTIHAVSSALVKLASQQRATTVYRVMSINMPPEKFFTPDDRGSCTCFEPAFMSTTTNLQHAIRLLVEQKLLNARAGAKQPEAVSRRTVVQERNAAEERLILFRIRVIPSDHAADVSFVSQCPLDDEVIFAPVTCFDVLDHYQEHNPNATVVDLRPRHSPARTIDQFKLKLKVSHLELINTMIEELKAAGAPEPALLPLNVLRTEHSDREDNNLTADQLVEDTSKAMQAHVQVLNDLTLDATWLAEKGATPKELSQRMLGVVALQARAGETDVVHEMMKLAFKRNLLSKEQNDFVEDMERYACATTSGQSKAVIKPSAIKKLFPPFQHSSLECAAYFLSQGMVPPWPPLMASLLSTLTPASHLAFGEMVRQKTSPHKGANVLIYIEHGGKESKWEPALCSPDGQQVRLSSNSQVVKVRPSLRILWPTDAGAGAILNEAAQRGDAALVRTLLNANVDLRYSDEHANSTLHHGVLSGNAEVCKHLMESRADPLIPNAAGLSAWDLVLKTGIPGLRRTFSPSTCDIDIRGGPSPAGWVSEHKREKEFVRQLLEAATRGDDGSIYGTLEAAAQVKVIDTPSLLQVTALMFAARNPNGKDAVSLLLDCKASVTGRSQQNCTALMMAAEEGNVDSVKLLLEAGKATGHNMINKLDSRGYNALHMAVENGHPDVVEALIRAGADPKVPRKNQWTPLLSAAYGGATDVLKFLTSADINGKFTGVGAFAPVHLAAYNDFDATLYELHRLGAQINEPMGTGWTPLMIASARGHAKACSALIAMKANVNFQSSPDGATALMAAVSNAYAPACVALLIQAKADLHKRDARGVDALMLAARMGHAQAVQQLIMQRADPRAVRHGGTTALMDAAAGGSERIVRLLLSAGAEVGAVDELGQSALFHATKGGHDLVLVPLLQAGANVQRLDVNGQTAIAHATKRQVARRLLEAGASSTQLQADMCDALGLPHKEGGSIPKLSKGLSSKSNAAVSDSARSKPGVKPSFSNPRPGQRMLGEEDKGPPLHAGESDRHQLRDALKPLLLPPQILDTAPLLKVFSQNATPEQLGAAFIVQNAYREMRWRRAKRKKQNFYQPKGMVLQMQMQANLQSQASKGNLNSQVSKNKLL